MFSEDIPESEIETLINKFENQRKFIFEKLKKNLDEPEEKNLTQQMNLVNGIQQSLIKLKKQKQKFR